MIRLSEILRQEDQFSTKRGIRTTSLAVTLASVELAHTKNIPWKAETTLTFQVANLNQNNARQCKASSMMRHYLLSNSWEVLLRLQELKKTSRLLKFSLWNNQIIIYQRFSTFLIKIKAVRHLSQSSFKVKKILDLLCLKRKQRWYSREHFQTLRRYFSKLKFFRTYFFLLIFTHFEYFYQKLWWFSVTISPLIEWQYRKECHLAKDLRSKHKSIDF